MLALGLFLTCFLAAGLPPITANATSNLVSWPGALSSAYGYRNQLRKLPAKYLLLLLSCAVGALLGCYLLEHTTSHDFSTFVPWLVLAAVVLFIFQPLLHRHLTNNLQAHRNAPLVVIGLALLPMSIYGGYFGAGFGFLMLAFLGFSRLTNIHQINGLKNLASATITLICTIYFGLTGLVDWHFAPFMVAGSLLGGFTGAHFAQKLHPELVHGFMVGLGLIVTTVLFIRS